MSQRVDLVGRWGVPEHGIEVAGRVRDFLETRVGIPRSAGDAAPRLAEEFTDALASPCRLGPDEIAAIVAVVGETHVARDARDRIAALGGASYADYVRRRARDARDLPDAVVSPGNHDEVVDVLRACSAHGIPVVPMGGGTSVVGGLRMTTPHVVVDLDRLGALISLDPVSCLVTVGPATTGPRLEALLAARGFTLGHLPQSWQRATMGGYAATRSAGQASSGYGRSDEIVESLRVATPKGTWVVGRGPSSAAGPDLRELVLGSEGALGIITELTLRVRRLPDTRIYEGVMLPSFEAGLAAFRDMSQERAGADVMRLSDSEETTATWTMSGPAGPVGAAIDRYLRIRGVPDTGAALAILGWEGTGSASVRGRREASWRVLKRHGAVSLGRRAGESWRRGRFHGPFLRDALMDAGYLVETVETAAHWSDYANLHEAVTESLQASLWSPPGPFVMSHVSHVYETGASLYTTILAVADPGDREGQWLRAKSAVGDAIAAQGATITHHHAVGRDHAPWLPGELGEIGMDALRAVKASVDPQGILNPGVLGLG